MTTSVSLEASSTCGKSMNAGARPHAFQLPGKHPTVPHRALRDCPLSDAASGADCESRRSASAEASRGRQSSGS
jgi:hypothetical protein